MCSTTAFILSGILRRSRAVVPSTPLVRTHTTTTIIRWIQANDMGVGCRRRRRRGHRDGLLSILILLHFLVNWHAAVCEQFRSRFRLPSIDSIVVVVGKSTRPSEIVGRMVLGR